MTDQRPLDGEMFELTPGARAVLDEYLEEARSQILSNAFIHSVRSGIGREITASDIARAVAEAPLSRRSRRIDLLVRVYGFVGISLTAAAAVFLFIQQEGLGGSSEEFVVLLLAVTGLLMALVSFAFIWTRRLRTARDAAESMRFDRGLLLVSEFLEGWRSLESAARDVVANELGPSKAEAPIGRLVQEAAGLVGFGSEDREILLKLAQTRNSIVHSPVEEVSRELRPADVEAVRRLSSRLRHAVD